MKKRGSEEEGLEIGCAANPRKQRKEREVDVSTASHLNFEPLLHASVFCEAGGNVGSVQLPQQVRDACVGPGKPHPSYPPPISPVALRQASSIGTDA